MTTNSIVRASAADVAPEGHREAFAVLRVTADQMPSARRAYEYNVEIQDAVTRAVPEGAIRQLELASTHAIISPCRKSCEWR